VQGVRDGNKAAEQWRFGGGPADTNHTPMIDLLWPDAGVQEQWHSVYAPGQAAQADLVVMDFARVGRVKGK
jgi:hypothetical protein